MTATGLAYTSPPAQPPVSGRTPAAAAPSSSPRTLATVPALAPERMLATALPARMIDVIRDGAHARDLRGGGDRAVWHALVSTASSALQRGWSRPQWADLVTEPRSGLGQQVRVDGRRRVRTAAAAEKLLTKAWTTAEKWLAGRPAPFTRQDALQLVREVLDWLPDAGLGDVDRIVLEHACTVALRHGTTRPTLPRREITAATGLGERTVRTALTRLDRAGLLRLEVRGTSSGPRARTRRASAYRLPDAGVRDAYLSRETRPVGPPAQFCGTPHDPEAGTPAQSCGTPHPTSTDRSTPMTTETTPTTDVGDALAAARRAVEQLGALVLLQAIREAQPLPDPQAETPEPVTTQTPETPEIQGTETGEAGPGRPVGGQLLALQRPARRSGRAPTGADPGDRPTQATGASTRRPPAP